jgi:hypothetical protein
LPFRHRNAALSALLGGRDSTDYVGHSNRETYRELARAGLMVVGNSFARGEASVYHVTKTGFERKAELLAATAPSPGSAAAPRR